jgi:uncharacterized repeat protein (TIGR03803 family)
MNRTSLLARVSAVAIAALTLFLTVSASASTVKVLYSFNAANGKNPVSGVVFDKNGNLYGTTPTGGSKDCGVVYQLTPGQNGKWTQTVIFEFDCLAKGGDPVTGLTIDAQGNLYGTTWMGGSHAHGTVFRLTKGQNGMWSEKVLHDFAWSTDGGQPGGSLVFDQNGKLYGTSFSGGAFGYGNVFRLTPDNQDHWNLDTLHSFNRDQHDGYNPLAGVIIGSDGSLYGTTKEGGSKGYGIVYQLIPNGNKWKEKILHTFNPENGKDGAYSQASLFVDANGSLYGTTQEGGKEGFYGIAFKLTFDLVSNKWQYSIIHSFTNGGDGGQPMDSLITDASGNVYGTTTSGGISGTAFKLALVPETGKWKETVLHKFKDGNDGSKPHSGLILDAAGNMYGTTQEGGSSDMGTVFQLIP